MFSFLYLRERRPRHCVVVVHRVRVVIPPAFFPETFELSLPETVVYVM